MPSKCYCPLAPSFSIRAASHATRAPSRFLAVPNKLEFECDVLLEIIHIIRVRCNCFVCYQVVLCVFPQEQIGCGHVYIECTKKVLKLLLLSTPKKYCAGKMRIHCFSGQVVFICTNKNGHCVGW